MADKPKETVQVYDDKTDVKEGTYVDGVQIYDGPVQVYDPNAVTQERTYVNGIEVRDDASAGKKSKGVGFRKKLAQSSKKIPPKNPPVPNSNDRGSDR